MRSIKFSLAAIFGLYIVTAFQQGLASRISIFGVAPDFPLIFVAVFSLFGSRTGSTVVGFFAGALEGAVAGVNLTHYIVTRTLAGFLGGASIAYGVQPNTFVAALVTAALTVLAQILLFFLAPPSGIGRFLGDTIGSAMYNGVLAIPLYALLRRILTAPGI